MEDFNDLKTLWQKENASVLPEAKEVTVLIQKFQQRRKRNLKLMIATAVFLAFIMILVTVNSDEYWTTVVGEVLIFASILLMIIQKIQSLKKVQSHISKTNAEYLDHLKNINHRERFKNQLFPMILLCVAYGFYIFSFVRDSALQIFIAYGILLLYFLFMWLVYRPWANRRFDAKSKVLHSKINQIIN